MTDQKLTQLPQATVPLSTSDIIYVVQGGASKQAPISGLPGGGSGTVTGAASEGTGQSILDTVATTSSTIVLKSLTAGRGILINVASDQLIILRKADTQRLVSGTTDTITGNDLNNFVTYTSNSAVAITLPNFATDPNPVYTVGYITELDQDGSGILTLSVQSGDTLLFYNPNSLSNPSSIGPGSTIRARIVAIDGSNHRTWLVSGDIVPPSSGSITGGIDSITSSGSNLLLVGDSATPGNSKYYGTNSGGTRGYFNLPASSTPTKQQEGASFSNLGSVIDASEANIVVFQVPYSGTIQSWTILTTGGSGSCQLDLWKTSYASYPPTISDSITASALPFITSGIKNTDSTLTGWTTAVAAGDVFAVKLVSSSVYTEINFSFVIQPS